MAVHAPHLIVRNFDCTVAKSVGQRRRPTLLRISVFASCSFSGKHVSVPHGRTLLATAPRRRRTAAMVASIGKITSAAQGVRYFEKDGYYARDDAAHKEASAWAGKGAAALGLIGSVKPEAFQSVLEGEVPGGRRLGRRDIDGSITHRPGRDVTLSSPKSVSLMTMVGGDERILSAHDKAVGAAPLPPCLTS